MLHHALGATLRKAHAFTGLSPRPVTPVGQNLGTQEIRDDQSQTESGWWARATPLKNMSASIGMMTFPILMGK